MVRMTAAEYQAMLRAQRERKPNKHRNHWVYVYEDGWIGESKDLVGHGKVAAKYASRKEFARHKELQLLERCGKIKNLRAQEPILLQEAFVNGAGKKIQPIYYKADFVYEEGGKKVVEDVKGIDETTGKIRKTEAFDIKWKMLQARYPRYVFRIF